MRRKAITTIMRACRAHYSGQGCPLYALLCVLASGASPDAVLAEKAACAFERHDLDRAAESVRARWSPEGEYAVMAILGDRVVGESLAYSKGAALVEMREMLQWERRHGEATAVRVLCDGEIVAEESVS